MATLNPDSPASSAAQMVSWGYGMLIFISVVEQWIACKNSGATLAVGGIEIVSTDQTKNLLTHAAIAPNGRNYFNH